MRHILFGGWAVFLFVSLQAQEISWPPTSQSIAASNALLNTTGLLSAAPENSKAAKKTESQKLVRPKKRPQKISKATSNDQLTPTMGSVFSVLGLLIFGASLAIYLRFRNRRFSFGRSKESVFEILESFAVPNAGQVHLVHLGRRLYLMSGAEKTVSCLDVISDPQECAYLLEKINSASSNSSFKNEYNQMIEQMSQGTRHEQPESQTDHLNHELNKLKSRLKELA